MDKKNPLLIVLGVSAVFFLIFIAVAVGTVMSLTSGSYSTQKKLFSKANNVGVIELNGVITDSKKILEQVDDFAEDPLIKAVVIRLNSPGGAVAPSQEIYEAVRKLAKKKPVYSSMSNLAASGAYYVAVATKKIYANPGTITGSIGVIMQFMDLSKLYQWAKLNPYVIKTGKFKDIGSPSREMGPEEKALLQTMAENVLMQFRRAVATGRNLDLDRVVELSDGRIFSGEQAKTVKLVDELGGIEETIEAVAKEAGISGKPNVVYGAKKKRLIERLLDEDVDNESSYSGASRSGGILEAFARALLRVAGVELERPSMGAASLVGPLFLMPHAAN